MARPSKWSASDRIRVIDLIGSGLTEREVARLTGIPKSSVHRMATERPCK